MCAKQFILVRYHWLICGTAHTNFGVWRLMSRSKKILLQLVSKWKVLIYSFNSGTFCPSQWPRGQRRTLAAARLLGLWVRIPPGAWMSVCCECCVLSGRGLCDGLITRPQESYRLWCLVVWSRNFVNEEAMAHWGGGGGGGGGLLRQKQNQKKIQEHFKCFCI